MQHTFGEIIKPTRLAQAVVAALALTSLYGQAAQGTAHSSDAQTATLQAVTVTATRREESLQKVPVAVSVVDGEQLERDNRNSVSSIVQQIPSVNFRTGASNKDTSLFIRGVGRYPPHRAWSRPSLQ